MNDADVNRAVGLSDGDLARAIASRPAGLAAAEEQEFHRRFAARVQLYGLRHLRDEERARDLAQRVMLLTIQQLRRGSVRRTELIGSLVLDTSRTVARQLSRMEQRRSRPGNGYRGRPGETPDADLACDLDRLESCLRQLEERDRAVLMLTFYAQKAAVDVGQELGLAAGHVRVIRHLALERLRDCTVTGRVPR